MSEKTDNSNKNAADAGNNQVWKNPAIVKAVSSILTEIITENARENSNSKNKDSKKEKYASIFNSKKPPSITIFAYLERIAKYTQIEESTLILCLIYIDRVCDLSKIQLNEFNIHRIILSFIIIAIKYNEDDYFSNEFYCKVGGITLQELNVLEFESLLLIRHTLFVEKEFFYKYKLYLDQFAK